MARSLHLSGWVMIVEDDPDHALLAKTCIDALDDGFQILHCATISEALSLLTASADVPPRAILVDIHLSDGSGLDLVAEVRRRERSRDVPIVMLTCTGDDAARCEALALSVNAFLTKPLTIENAFRVLSGGYLRWELSDLPADLSLYRERIRTKACGESRSR